MRFTLFPLTSSSRPKVKHKVGALNKVSDDLRWRASLLLMQKDEAVGVDQLKDRGSKFSGAHLYPDGSTNTMSSFSQVGENDATDIWGKRIRSIESSVPVDQKLRKASFPEKSVLQRPRTQDLSTAALVWKLWHPNAIRVACLGFRTITNLPFWFFYAFLKPLGIIF